MSSNGIHNSNCDRKQSSSSNANRSGRSSVSSPYLGPYAGNPYSRYETGPFSYESPSTTARCTSSYHRYVCGHTSSVRIQRVAGCIACATESPHPCTPRVIQVAIPTKCVSCQPHHHREQNGDLTRSTRRDRVRNTFEEWQRRSNTRDYSNPYSQAPSHMNEIKRTSLLPGK
jgi:hypothetical protein